MGRKSILKGSKFREKERERERERERVREKGKRRWGEVIEEKEYYKRIEEKQRTVIQKSNV